MSRRAFLLAAAFPVWGLVKMHEIRAGRWGKAWHLLWLPFGLLIGLSELGGNGFNQDSSFLFWLLISQASLLVFVAIWLKDAVVQTLHLQNDRPWGAAFLLAALAAMATWSFVLWVPRISWTQPWVLGPMLLLLGITAGLAYRWRLDATPADTWAALLPLVGIQGATYFMRRESWKGVFSLVLGLGLAGLFVRLVVIDHQGEVPRVIDAHSAVVWLQIWLLASVLVAYVTLWLWPHTSTDGDGATARLDTPGEA